ncbi:MAG: hypothetical protein QME58_09230 [Bacteroidota bacterium]|nr:hypothetical protein [Bacteroidota bacterium]
MSEFIHILWYKLKSNLKLTIDLSLQGIIKNLGSVLLYGAFAVGAYVLTYNIIEYLLKDAKVGMFLLHRFLSMLLFVFFVTVNLGNVIVSYSTLYKSKEILYLFTKPVSFVNIFMLKFLDNFFYSSTTLFLIGLAVIAGYGSYFSMPLGFYFVVLIFIFIPFMLISAILAVLLLFLLIKIASHIGPAPVIAGLVTGYVGSIFFYFKFVNPYKLVNEIMKYYPHTDQYFEIFMPVFLKYLPNHWVSEFLYWTVKGNYIGASFYGLMLITAALFLFLIMFVVGRMYYRKSWLVSLEFRFFSKKQIQNRKVIFQKNTILQCQTDALLKKEFLQFFRDPSQWLHLAVLVLLMLVFGVSVSRFEYNYEQPFLQSVTYVVIYLFTAFLIASMAIRFVYPLISIEASSFWKIKSSPLSIQKFFNTKIIFVFIPIILVGIMLSIFSNWSFRKEQSLLYFSTYTMIFVAAALVIINISGGSFFASFNEKNPIRIASTQGASLIFLMSLVFLVFTAIIISSIVLRYFEYSHANKIFPHAKIIYTSLGFGGISLLISVICYIVGLKSLNRDFK